MLAIALVVIAVAALILVVVVATRGALDRLDSRAERRRVTGAQRSPEVQCTPEAWRQWAGYYRGLAEQARAEGNARSAATYSSLAETYRLLGGDVP